MTTTMKTYNSNLPEFKLKKTTTDFRNVKITTSKDGADYIRQFFSDDLEIYESFFLLLLNRANNTIGYAKISQGGCVGTVVDIKLIAKFALESLAQQVIVCHNHPSGNTQPSDADKNITQKIVNTLNLFDCKVIDHIILTKDSHFSFADEGLV